MSRYKDVAKLMVNDYLELEEITQNNPRGIPHTKLGLKYGIDSSYAGNLWRGVRMGILEESDETMYGKAVRQMYKDNIVENINNMSYREVDERYHVQGNAGMTLLLGLQAVKLSNNKQKRRVFGHIPGISVGKIFVNRKALAHAGIHNPTQAGISGSKNEGADSIVLSGGYEDDMDHGNIIIYTGAGGRDEGTGKQVKDQTLTRYNLALAKSKINNLPVRVTRGSSHKSKFSPSSGYEYAGLYKVVDYWKDIGSAGFVVWRFRLELYSGDLDVDVDDEFEFNDEDKEHNTKRTTTTSSRIVRDRDLADKVKKLYKYECQICGVALETSAGLYAEAAHIQPLGSPHNGPDKSSNMLCLCPNHHVLFDNGGFTIKDDFTLVGMAETLYVHSKHKISLKYIQYHRKHYSL